MQPDTSSIFLQLSLTTHLIPHFGIILKAFGGTEIIGLHSSELRSTLRADSTKREKT